MRRLKGLVFAAGFICACTLFNKSGDVLIKASQSVTEVAETAKAKVKDKLSFCNKNSTSSISTDSYTYSADFGTVKIPAYASSDYVIINNGVPYFTTKEEHNAEAFEHYSSLDKLGRCGTAYANICKEIMPTEKRGEIGKIKPTGWHQNKYDIVKEDGNPAGYLYNRCHLIGFQLAGENANKKNLITGTRYFNATSMLPFENEVADYVHETGNHILYRVSPVFEGNNLLADGVLMEAYSVEDQGKGVEYCVFVYNIQPGITLDYKTGENSVE